MHKVYTILIMTATALLLSSCSTIMRNTYQKIMVETDPAGAICSLHNDKGSWGLNTPGMVTIKRSAADLYLSCFHPGYLMSVKTISGLKGYPNSIWINLSRQEEYSKLPYKYKTYQRRTKKGYDAATAKD